MINKSKNLKLLLDTIRPLEDDLKNHSIYSNIKDLNDLQVFMSNHVYAVWDFMSLLKYIQNYFAPSTTPWKPNKNQKIVRFINEIVVAEESDQLPDETFMSHFELYCKSMNEINLDTNHVYNFINLVENQGLNQAFMSSNIPNSTIAFMKTTFSFIQNNKPHEVAAAFTFGRENIIPEMFQSLLLKMNISKEQAPYFHYYLQRHIDIDGDEHGPISLEMIELICQNDNQKWKETTQAAISSIKARIKFWDDINLLLSNSDQFLTDKIVNNRSSFDTAAVDA